MNPVALHHACPLSVRGCIAGSLSLIASAGTMAAAAITETPVEFLGTGDFDGDGRTDVLIVDRASGSYRVGYQSGVDQWTWSRSRPTGLEQVNAVSVGRLEQATLDSLAVADPRDNALMVLSPVSAEVFATPAPQPIRHLGPNAVAVVAVAGHPLADLWVGSLANDPPNPSRYEVLARSGNVDLTYVQRPLGAPVARAAALALKTGTAERVLALESGAQTDRLLAWEVSGAAGEPLAAGGLEPGSHWVGGFFGNSPLACVLSFVPRGSNLVCRAVVESQPGQFDFAAPVRLVFDQPLEWALVTPDTPARLVLIFAGGTVAGVYDYDGADAPALVETFRPAAGEVFTGMVALDGGSFVLLSGVAGGRSGRFATYHRAGPSYRPGAAGTLPLVSELAAGPNVLFFEREPFVHPIPGLVGAFRAGDWAEAVQLQGLPPTASVLTASFASEAQGLQDAVLTALPPVPASARFGLANQLAPMLSVLPQSQGAGTGRLDVRIRPAAGSYANSVTLGFDPSDPGAKVFFRTAPGAAWVLFQSDQPPRLFTDATVEAFAEKTGEPARSPLRAAAYHFTRPPEEQDSDGDGVPDFVEIAHGLDPRAGPDSDGDGADDATELRAGTRPDDPGSFPGSPTPAPSPGGGLEVTPYVEFNHRLQVPARVQVHDTSGSLLGSAFTDRVGSNLTARVRTLPAGEGPLRFIWARGLEHPEEEVLGVLARAEWIRATAGAYQYGGGPLADEANRWLAARNQTPPDTVEILGPEQSLEAALLEEKLRQSLRQRGAPQSEQFTLFPFLTRDQGRPVLAPADFQTLGLEVAPGQPGYPAADLLLAIRATLRTPDEAGGRVLAAAADLWQAARQLLAEVNFGPPPAGTVVIYYSRATRPHGAVWRVNADGTEDRFMTVGHAPRVSGDGRWMAFLRDGWDTLNFGGASLFLRDLGTGEERRLVPNSDYLVNCAFTRDSQFVVFDLVCSINQVRLDGTDVRQLIGGDCYDDAPAVNPVDGRIAFHGHSVQRLGLANADGSGKHYLEATGVRDFWPNWSNDGQWLSFCASDDRAPGRGRNLFRIRPDGTGRLQLTFLEADGDYFTYGGIWLPGDAELLAAGVVGGVPGLYRVKTDGSGALLRLPTAAGDPPQFAGGWLLASPGARAKAGARLTGEQPDRAELLSGFETLRRWLRGAPLPDHLLALTTLGEAERTAAHDAAMALVDRLAPRTLLTRRLRVRADSFRDNCTVLEGADAPGRVSLITAQAAPYRPPAGFVPPAGSEVEVTAYAASPDGQCADSTLEVSSFRLVKLPPLDSADRDGNGLADAWELLLGTPGLDPEGDPDGDGFSNRAEYLAGTDPHDALSRPTVELPRPVLALERQAGAQVRLTWAWPEAGIGPVRFRLWEAEELVGPFRPLEVNPRPVPGGWELVLPVADHQTRFFRLGVEP